MKKQFAILRLGRFGGSLCREFNELGMEDLAINNEIEKVNAYADSATHAVQLNSTEEVALSNIGIRIFDVVIVAIGENIQSSIFTTLLLKEMGVNKFR